MPSDTPQPSKFASEAEDITTTQCNYCEHLIRGTGFTCSAYPDGIPANIILNEVDHRRPQPGDHGIRFEARPGVPAATLRLLWGKQP